MIGIETNLLVYAHRADAPQHQRAQASLRPAVEGELGPIGIPWPCLHEFLAVVTRPLWSTPMPIVDALESLRRVLAGPGVEALAETRDHLRILTELCPPGLAGGKVHDARIAAICTGHGVRELWSADRDFGAFPGLRVRNPLVDPAT
ncbi:MAG: type II toxin-antitoxin system VapC family toxin [Nitriliruptoraceae bacterium]